ncbi:hypothetical protein UFOVP75_217 [uncultured Caudovirales phage]|uniref:Uncharacterized protein n=1 Tax=uncultured Caudovirales phage TaxID=2100421 RepID=A0A6J5L6F6_9CAUD|nr:hypothetical protein UFOVP75_217 [uncultured Caudovirales phage]
MNKPQRIAWLTSLQNLIEAADEVTEAWPQDPTVGIGFPDSVYDWAQLVSELRIWRDQQMTICNGD